jgi:BirA family biotin operon repressor/biotin-[acetyl-CoA-carboxylase] ligase
MDEATLRNLFSLESEQTIGQIQIYDEIDSTNSESIRQIQTGREENRLIVAASQFEGKGRRDRQWLSPKGGGIYLSLTRRFSLQANALQGLSLVTAISVAEALHTLGVVDLQLKWPNDVLSKKKKLAGILLEFRQTKESRFVVFGIGINTNLPPEVLAGIDRPVTDLKGIMDKLPSGNVLVAALINRLCENLSKYERSGFAVFEEHWNNLDCYRMSDVVIQNGENRLVGKSLGVDSSGALLVQTSEGIKVISGGEVFPSLRPLSE